MNTLLDAYEREAELTDFEWKPYQQVSWVAQKTP